MTVINSSVNALYYFIVKFVCVQIVIMRGNRSMINEFQNQAKLSFNTYKLESHNCMGQALLHIKPRNICNPLDYCIYVSFVHFWCTLAGNVRFSHLRSKEFINVHKSRDTTKCTLVYIQMHIARECGYIKQAQHFDPSPSSLIWLQLLLGT